MRKDVLEDVLKDILGDVLGTIPMNLIKLLIRLKVALDKVLRVVKIGVVFLMENVTVVGAILIKLVALL